MHVATIRLDPEVWAVVEQRARRERRPIDTMLRMIVSDAVAPPPAAPQEAEAR